MNLSRKTVLELGHALEMSAALHVLTYKPDRYDKWIPKQKNDPYVNTGHKACLEAVAKLRRALRLPKTFSFTSARMRAYTREEAQWHARALKRARARKLKETTS